MDKPIETPGKAIGTVDLFVPRTKTQLQPQPASTMERQRSLKRENTFST